jgi:hypothetical protein
MGRRGLTISILHPGDASKAYTPIPQPGKPVGVRPPGRTYGRGAGRVTVEVSEAGLLPVEALPPLPDGFRRQEPFGVFVHELAHAVERAQTPGEKGFHRDLFESHTAHGGAFPTPYAAQKAGEYFAEATSTYFGTHDWYLSESRRGLPSDDGTGAGWLRENDPNMLAELARIFGPPTDLSANRVPRKPRLRTFARLSFRK